MRVRVRKVDDDEATRTKKKRTRRVRERSKDNEVWPLWLSMPLLPLISIQFLSLRRLAGGTWQAPGISTLNTVAETSYRCVARTKTALANQLSLRRRQIALSIYVSSRVLFPSALLLDLLRVLRA